MSSTSTLHADMLVVVGKSGYENKDTTNNMVLSRGGS